MASISGNSGFFTLFITIFFLPVNLSPFSACAHREHSASSRTERVEQNRTAAVPKRAAVLHSPTQAQFCSRFTAARRPMSVDHRSATFPCFYFDRILKFSSEHRDIAFLVGHGVAARTDIIIGTIIRFFAGPQFSHGAEGPL